MTKVAIVIAANYKAVGYGFEGVSPCCPEALLPIPDKYGGTPMARLAEQLRKSDYKVYIAVGRNGCRYTGFLGKCVINPTSCLPAEAMPEVDRPPWTDARLKYVAQCGIPLLMPDPDMKSYENSAMQSLDMIGTDWWDQLAILQCDFVWSDAGLLEVLAQKAPCQVLVKRRHVITPILTPETARLYRRLGDKYRHREKWGWTLEMGRWGKAGLPPEGKEFRRAAPYIMLDPGGSAICAADLDVPKDYRHLLEHWLPQYG